MKVLVVGNILKDIYLNLDTRSEQFETDRSGTKWLNLSFNNSEHHFFRRHSCLSGAAITLEVLHNMGIETIFTNPNFTFADDGINFADLPDDYRYILNSDGQISYFIPSDRQISQFIPPAEPVDYIFLDRSAEINSALVQKILAFLDNSPATKLVVHARPKSRDQSEKLLLSKADLILSERQLNDIPAESLIYLDHFKNAREHLLTHLSLYSIASATILGGLLIGKTLDQSLKYAKANVEGSTLDATLSLSQLEELAA